MIYKTIITLRMSVSVALLLGITSCFAQKIELKDIAKIKLTVSGSNVRYIEVFNENGNWKSYQTRYDHEYKTDSTKRFIKNIPDNFINELLEAINKPDTSVNLSHYNLDETKLIAYIDTINANLKPNQKAEFVRALQSKSILNEMLLKAVTPLEMDDAPWYSITITTKSNKSYDLNTYAFGYRDFIPWKLGSVKNYNPAIYQIFRFISEDKSTENEAKEQLYYRINKELYWKYFETKFNWADFKEEEYGSFALLANTLTPVRFAMKDGWWSGSFVSSQLPHYLKISTGFKKNDVIRINQFKRFEDTLAHIYKQGNFLFDYFKDKPKLVAYMSSGKSAGEADWYFNDIRVYFTDIDKYDRNQLRRFRVIEIDGNVSEWLLIEDKIVILLKYTGELNKGYNTAFTGVIPNFKTQFTQHYVCLVFDRTGKRTGGVEKADTIGPNTY